MGQGVEVQVGGSFFLSGDDMRRPLLFIAGGIGITPIASMVAHLVAAGPAPDQAWQPQRPAALLLYSAGTADELVFKQELLELAEQSQGGDHPMTPRVWKTTMGLQILCAQ